MFNKSLLLSAICSCFIFGSLAYGNSYLFVSGIDNNTLVRYDGDTGLNPVYYGSDSILNKPHGLHATSDGIIYLTNVYGNNIMRFDALTGENLDSNGNGTGLGYFITDPIFNGPVGMDIGTDGFLYVTNSFADQVLRFDLTTGANMDSNDNGTNQGYFLSGGLLNFPIDIRFHPNGTLFITGRENLLKYTESAGLEVFVYNETSFFNYLAFGTDGNVYVSDYDLDLIYRFDPLTGRNIDASGQGGNDLGYFATYETLDAPTGIEFGPDGNLYVSNRRLANEILRFDGTTGEFIDVFAYDEGLDGPQGIAFYISNDFPASTVPEPGTIVLLGTALFLLRKRYLS